MSSVWSVRQEEEYESETTTPPWSDCWWRGRVALLVAICALAISCLSPSGAEANELVRAKKLLRSKSAEDRREAVAILRALATQTLAPERPRREVAAPCSRSRVRTSPGFREPRQNSPLLLGWS